jgi:SAM-dependent methyltransferase
MNESPESKLWNAHYKTGRPGWDLEGPPPVLTELIETIPEKPLRILVPCAGYAHDAMAWAKAGHEVVAMDFAPLAVQGARERAGTQGIDLTIQQADMFQPDDQLKGTFDIIWEQTCLAAIDPGRRAEYFKIMAASLKPQGKFYGLLWNHGRQGGPPYNISVGLIDSLVAPYFQIDNWEWVDPEVAKRKKEFLVTLRRK